MDDWNTPDFEVPYEVPTPLPVPLDKGNAGSGD